MFDPIPFQRQIGLHGTWSGERTIAVMLQEFENIDMGPLFASFNVDLQELHGQYFLSETDPDDLPWPPLADSTIAAKGHDDILFETGALLRSLTETHDENAIRDMQQVGDAQAMQFGTEVEYAAAHMTGTRNMPARPMVGLSDEVVDAMAEQTADYVVGKMLEGIN